jgi:integrase
VVAELNRKLANGWSPFVEQDAPQAHITLGAALDKFVAVKNQQLRHSSPYSYSSMTQMLRTWAGEQGLLQKYAHAFNRGHAVGFMNWVSDVRLVQNRTYNNYLVFFSMLFKWMMEQGIRTDNPMKGFARRKVGQKTRTYLTEQDREEMAEWIDRNDPRFWLPCMFLYGALIRPGELKRLRVHHVDLVNQVVMVPAEESKNGYERMPAIPDWMVEELRRMELHRQPGKCWLVGAGLVPNAKPLGRNALNRHWVKMRKALGWSHAKQLYSLRDTGIIQLLRDGVNILDVRQQAGHEDIATTNEYLKHAFPNGPKEVREKGTPLQATSPMLARPLFTGPVEEQRAIPRFVELERTVRPR